ncbi:hypothetical protein PMI34_03449, partial [Pseudomonas sp. GM74]
MKTRPHPPNASPSSNFSRDTLCSS